MRRVCYAAFGVMAAAAITTPGIAQQRIEWKQVINTPKGVNLPKGLKLDILGIELGEPFADVKRKMEAIRAEDIKPAPPAAPPQAAAPQGAAPRGPSPAQMLMLQRMREQTEGRTPQRQEPPAIRQTNIVFKLPTGAAPVDVSYVGGLYLARYYKGTGTAFITEYLDARFSAPSSGHQLIGISRSLHYNLPQDHPRISELLARLVEKVGGQPQRFPYPQSIDYRFQFDGGRLVAPPGAQHNTCVPQYRLSESNQVRGINPRGDCDVVLDFKVRIGMSPDHAQSIEFILSDNERTKANVGADFAFFESYARDLQSRARGVAPKL